MGDTISFVLFSGTDDKLQAAAVMSAGAAALGKRVNIFLQYWALDAFRKDRIDLDHGLSPEAGEAGRAAVDALRAAGRPAGRTPSRRPRSSATSTSRPAPSRWTSSTWRSRTSTRSWTAWRA